MKQLTTLLLALFLVPITLKSQAHPEVDLDELDRYFEKMVADWDIPSASIGIVKDGELVFTGNYGVLEAGKPGAPDSNRFQFQSLYLSNHWYDGTGRETALERPGTEIPAGF